MDRTDEIEQALKSYLPSLDPANLRALHRREYFDRLGASASQDAIRQLTQEIDQREEQRRLEASPHAIAYFLMRNFGKTAAFLFASAKMDADRAWIPIWRVINSEYLWNVTPSLKF